MHALLNHDAAQAEWDANFRSDLSSLLDDAVIDAAVDHSRPPELPPVSGTRHFCFVDMSAGRHDHSTACIGHKEKDQTVIDVVRGLGPPHDPASVAAEFAELAKMYHCREIVGDAFAGEWVACAFKANGMNYNRSELSRSELYLESLPL